jgi:hypothetical protein
VGTAGFVIDLAVVDPVMPGRFLLGIECDGATYHSARSARDRDRLREAVLRDRGWRIHRVWSTDWFHRPAEQLQKIVGAIEKARIQCDSDEEFRVNDADHPADIEGADGDIERGPESEKTNGEMSFPWAIPYEESREEVPDGTPIHETSPSILVGIVTAVVRVEGPIHKEEIARRVTSLWGLQRTGPRIAEAVAKAVDAGIRSGALRAEMDFVTHGQQTVVPVRNRSEVAAANVKKPEMIPPSEVRQAILHLVTEHVGLRREELPLLVGKALGFRAASAKLKDLIEKVLASMLEDGEVASRDQKLFLP